MKLIIYLFTAVFCFPISAANDNEKAKKTVNIVTVAVQPYQPLIKRTGTLAFKSTLSLAFKSSGYLAELSVDEGEYFTQGQRLARLDITELAADKNSKYAQLMAAKREVDRVRALKAKKLSSESQLDNAKTVLAMRRSAYKVAFYTLEKAQIIAPFNGIVLNKTAELTALQSAGKPILTVAATENNWVVKVILTAAEINQVRLKQNVQVNLFQAGLLTGIVSKVPALADRQTNLFTIEALLPKFDNQQRMIAGQRAEVIIKPPAQEYVYNVPMSALIGVDKQGKAILALQSPQTKNISRQKFSIVTMDNDYIYLLASSNSPPLQVVKHGWQNINFLAK
jgi:RND family efflux transporter MFP subunit